MADNPEMESGIPPPMSGILNEIDRLLKVSSHDPGALGYALSPRSALEPVELGAKLEKTSRNISELKTILAQLQNKLAQKEELERARRQTEKRDLERVLREERDSRAFQEEKLLLEIEEKLRETEAGLKEEIRKVSLETLQRPQHGCQHKGIEELELALESERADKTRLLESMRQLEDKVKNAASERERELAKIREADREQIQVFRRDMEALLTDLEAKLQAERARGAELAAKLKAAEERSLLSHIFKGRKG